MFLAFVILGTLAGGVAAVASLLAAGSPGFSLLLFSATGCLITLIASGVVALRGPVCQEDEAGYRFD